MSSPSQSQGTKRKEKKKRKKEKKCQQLEQGKAEKNKRASVLDDIFEPLNQPWNVHLRLLVS